MYVINEWLERYEVNDKGQPARAGDKLRVRPLEYIRSKIHGRAQGAGFYQMQLKAGARAYEVFGIFQKFLEIAGDSGADDRGKLLNQRGRPATAADLAKILRTSESKIKFALQILTDKDVAWILSDAFQNFQENSEIPGIPGALYNSTEHNGTELNRTEGNIPGKPGKSTFLEFVKLTDKEHAKLIECLGPTKTNEYIKKLNNYIGSKGKKYKSHYHTILSWSDNDGARTTGETRFERVKRKEQEGIL